MPKHIRNRGHSVVRIMSATLLIALAIALASVIQYSNGGSISTATVLKGAAVEVLLQPIATKIPVPFGHKGALQVSIDRNKTSIQRGPDLRHDAVGLRKRLLTW